MKKQNKKEKWNCNCRKNNKKKKNKKRKKDNRNKNKVQKNKKHNNLTLISKINSKVNRLMKTQMSKKLIKAKIMNMMMILRDSEWNKQKVQIYKNPKKRKSIKSYKRKNNKNKLKIKLTLWKNKMISKTILNQKINQITIKIISSIKNKIVMKN